MQPWIRRYTRCIYALVRGRIGSTCAPRARSVLYALRPPARVNRLDFHVRYSNTEVEEHRDVIETDPVLQFAWFLFF